MEYRPVVEARGRCVNDDDFAETVIKWIEADPGRVQSFLDFMELTNDRAWHVAGDPSAGDDDDDEGDE